MTKRSAIATFKENYPKGTYDYWQVQESWACYVDGLCKDGEITQKQYDAWTTPFKYGKNVTFK